MGVLLCAVTKSCGQVRALVTLSPWPCCRGGVRACVVCAYLGIVTWTGREVTITIRLLYGPYTIDASPHHGFTMPHRFCAQRKPPPSRKMMGVTSTTSEQVNQRQHQHHDPEQPQRDSQDRSNTRQLHVTGASHAAFQVLTPISESTASFFSAWNLRATVAVRGP